MTRRTAAGWIAILMFILPAFHAGAWCRWEHRVIAEIAEQNLSPAARAKVAGILGPDTKLAGVSGWADWVRKYRRYTAPWHYINYPLELDEPDYDVMKAPGGNIVYAIETRIALLRDPAVSGEIRAEALKFLIHFMGDIHQPLHCGKGEDRGGNAVPVTWKGEAANLHSVWDCSLSGGGDSDPVLWAIYLLAGTSPEDRVRIMVGRPYDWMVESHKLARDFCYPQLLRYSPSSPGGGIPELSGGYAAAARPVVRRRLVEAGLRLAMVLNDIFGREEGEKAINTNQKTEDRGQRTGKTEDRMTKSE